MLAAHRDARWPPERHVQTKLNAGCPPKETQGAHQKATWLANEHLVPTKMPGGHKNAMCSGKEMLDSHQDARWPPNHDMPTKEMLVAHRDARWPPERHVQTKLNAGCPPKGNTGCPPKSHVASKRNAG